MRFFSCIQFCFQCVKTSIINKNSIFLNNFQK